MPVAQKCGEYRQAALDVLARLIPLKQDLRRAAVAKVLQSRPTPIRRTPQPRLTRELIKDATNRRDFGRLATRTEQEVSGIRRIYKCTPLLCVARQGPAGGSVQRDQTCFAK